MYKIVGADQKEYGPVDADQIKAWITEGRANGQTVARFEDGPWKPLRAFPEFAADLAAAPPALATGAPPPTGAGAPAGHIPNYLVPAILVTLCCCLPLGIPAIVYAAQVNSKLADGNIAGAQYASQQAKMWCWIALAAGILATVVYLILGATGALAVPTLQP